MAREVVIKISIDSEEAEASVERLEKAIKNLGNQGGSTNKKDSPLGGGYDSQMQKALADIRRYQDSARKAETDYTNFVNREAEKQYRAKVAQWQRGANDFLKILNEQRKAETSSAQFQKDLFQTIFGATTLSGLAVNAISAVARKTGELANETANLAVKSVSLAGDFELATNAITVFAGSTSLARRELAAVDREAANTPGLRLISAEEGYTRLRALNFEADTALNLIKGLGKQRLISGATDLDVQRVIVNFTQLSASSQNVTRDIKEIIHAIPSLRGVFREAFGTLETSKLKDLLDRNPDEFFERLSVAMANAKVPVGGLNDAFGKLQDEFFQSGRAFGEPILEPLSKDVRELTDYLRENRDGWKEWGEFAANAIQGASDVWRGFSSLIPQQENVSGKEYPVRNLLRASLFGALPNSIYQYGKQERENAEAAFRKSAPVAGLDSIKRKTGKTGFDSAILSDQNTIQFETAKETATRIEGEQRKLAERIDSQRKQLIENLKSQKEQILSFNDDFYKVQESRLASHLDYTKEQELQTLKSVSASRQANLQSQLSITQNYYSDLIKFGNLEGEELLKTENEKNREVSKLTSELAVNQIKSQFEVLQKERQIFEERRQAQIQFNQLQIQQSQNALDNKSYEIERTKGDYSGLIAFTQETYQKISQLTIESYQLQLQNLSLTKEQRLNLTIEMYLSEQKLAEDNRRRIIEIEEKQYQQRIQQLDEFSDNTRSRLKSISNLFAGVSSSLGSTTISKDFVGNLGNLFFGGNFDSYENEIKEAIKLNEKYRDSINPATGSRQDYDNANLAIDFLQQNLKELRGLYPAFQVELYRTIKGYEQGTISIKEFQKTQLELFDKETLVKVNDYNVALSNLTEKINAAATAGKSDDRKGYEKERNQLIDEKTLFLFSEANKRAEIYANTIDGLRETIEKFKRGDITQSRQLNDAFLTESLKEQANSYYEIEKLKYQLANSPYLDSLAIEKAQLEDLTALRNKDTQAIISANRAQLELSQKGNFSALQADAQVLEYLNQNIKSSTDAMADFKIGIASGFLEQIDSPFKKLNDRLEKLPPLVKGIAQSFVSLANDIVRAFSQKLIMRLLGLETPTANGQSSASGGGFGGILQGLFGGGGSNGGFRTPSFNPNSFNFGGGSSSNSGYFINPDGTVGGGSGASLGSLINLPGAALNSEIGGGQGGILSRLLGEGGIFGKEGFGNNVGTYSAVGAGATILGNLISSSFGGSAVARRLGGTLSGAGTGLGIGAAIGSIVPGIGTVIGALVGAGIGGLIGFFGAGGQRKKDERARTEYINNALASFGDFDKLIGDVRALRIDGGSAISQATQLGANIRSNYLAQASQLKDNKTRNIAIKDVSRIDDQINAKMKDLRAAADEARVAGDIDKRLNASFAGGVYMDKAFRNQYGDFKRRNGMLPGVFTGRDYLPSFLADGELVLNDDQRLNVIRNAGGVDPFKGAGIPNYAGGTFVEPKTPTFSAPNFSGSGLSGSRSENTQTIVFSPEMEIHLSGIVGLEDEIEGYLNTGDGQRKIIKIVRDGTNRKISS